MPVIDILVRDKVATAAAAELVCGNSDYILAFDFDAEWAEYETKTARFAYNGTYQDIVFDGTECPAPVITNATMCQVGVYAGDLHTTTPAVVWCKKSILCEGGAPADPPEDVYARILEKINHLEGAAPDDIAAAVETYMAENPVQSYNIGAGLKLDTATNTLFVDTADAVEQDNTKPITSAAVYTTVGNIEVLLSTI